MSDKLTPNTSEPCTSHRPALLQRNREIRLRLVSGISYSLLNTATTLSAFLEGIAQPWWLFYARLFFAAGVRGI